MPSSQMRTQLKRLLDTDRALGRNKRSADPERANYAFYSTDAPGTGTENWFSEYETFGLFTGLRLLQHGWPQGFAVAVLRRVRPELEQQHARILKQDPAKLLDWEQIRAQAKPGDLVDYNTDPVFLAIITGGGGDTSRPVAAICRGRRELMTLSRGKREQGGVGQVLTTFELVNSVFDLSSALAETKPRKRGRGSA